MSDSLQILRDEYERLKLDARFKVLGLVEIGSRALGQAISTSDYDTRLIIETPEPYVVHKDTARTSSPSFAVTCLEWVDLNRVESQGVTFGLTNLGYVERCAKDGRFPLSDHTALYQGRLLIDEDGGVKSFRDQYEGVAFANIVPDYRQLTDWRVEHRLSAEMKGMNLDPQLDRRKLAIPALHTCCRVVQDIANTESYHERTTYLDGLAAIAKYYQAHWPWFLPAFQSLFEYKIDETRRRGTFEGVERRDPEYLRQLMWLHDETVLLWKRYNEGNPGDHMG